MKKLNYLILGLAGLAMASCSQDDMLNAPQGEGNYNITVQLPIDMATRALGDGYTAENLLIAVYDADDNNSFVFQDKATFGNALQTTVSLNLPQKKSYKIAFFAVSDAGQKVYQFNPQAETPNITVQYGEDAYNSADNLADAYDCFYKLHETGIIGSDAVNTTVKLVRPVAQINWGTNDINAAVGQENAFGPNGKYIVSNLTITNAYTQFSLLDGDVMGDQTSQTISGLASPASTPESAEWVFPVLPEEYEYIAMQYVLAPYNEGNGGVYDLALDVYNAPNKDVATITNEIVNVNNAPVQANYRTNIYGMLLTNPTEFYVEKSPEWGGNYDPSLELAFLRGGTFTLPDDITISKRLTVPVGVNLVLDLNGNTLTSTYGSDGFILVDGGSLTIKGNGAITDGNPDDDYQALVFVANGGTVNIEDGDFTGYGEGQLIYVEQGTANVSGGTFWLKDDTSGDNWCLNCQDTNYTNGTAKINVTGGTFYNWNPAVPNTEKDKNATFVVKGYESVSTSDGTNTLYTVVPAGTMVANSDTSLKEAVSSVGEGGNILVKEGTYSSFPNCANLAKDVTIECEEGTVFNVTAANINLNGGTLKGAKFTWSNTGSGSSSTRTITGTLNGNYINCDFTGYEAVRYAYAGQTCYFEGCTFSGSLYGCHFDGGANDVTFVDCTFQGFNAFAEAITLLTMDNCTFSANGKASYNGVNLWGITKMTGCNFEFDGTVNNEWIDAKKSLTMTDCFINGIPASDPSVSEYFENISNITFN